jgi:hypothetical protein
MLIQGQVGAPALNASLGPGANPPVRQGNMGDLIVSELHGRYYETNYRGSLFGVALNSITVGATNISPVNGTNTTPLLTIFNPIGSGKNLSLVKITQSLVSGTPGGPFVWNVLALPQTITNTTFTTPFNLSTLQQAGSLAKVWTQQAIGSATVAGTAFRTAGGFAAAAAGAGVNTYTEEYAGDFIVPQGTAVSLCAYATGTTHIFSAFVEWEELPV